MILQKLITEIGLIMAGIVALLNIILPIGAALFLAVRWVVLLISKFILYGTTTK